MRYYINDLITNDYIINDKTIINIDFDNVAWFDRYDTFIEKIYNKAKINGFKNYASAMRYIQKNGCTLYNIRYTD